jgi:hypothetical protein
MLVGPHSRWMVWRVVPAAKRGVANAWRRRCMPPGLTIPARPLAACKRRWAVTGERGWVPVWLGKSQSPGREVRQEGRRSGSHRAESGTDRSWRRLPCARRRHRRCLSMSVPLRWSPSRTRRPALEVVCNRVRWRTVGAAAKSCVTSAGLSITGSLVGGLAQGMWQVVAERRRVT